MKEKLIAISSLWRKYKAFLYLKIAIIPVLALTIDLAAAGSVGRDPLTNISQQLTVTGTVTDSQTGEAMPGVNIQVKGTTVGTISDMAGKYSLPVPDRDVTLAFSFIGYVTQEIPLNGRTTLDIALVGEIKGLEEVVVVGYGTQRKASLTGSVSTVDAVNLQIAPTINFSTTLAGRLPGLVAVAFSGEPGKDDLTLRIRGTNTLGNNSPLIVVDGIAGRSITNLAASDIESVTVLKDASAAIYGAQAANGVILVTTKRGTVKKPEISVRLNKGWNMPTRIPEMADAATYCTMINEIDGYNNQAHTYTDEEIQKFRDGSDPWRYPNTDWFGLVFKSFSNQYMADISVSGGSENSRFFVSGGYDFQDAIYKNSSENYSRSNFRANIDTDITENISLGIDLSGFAGNGNYSSKTTSQIFSSLITGGSGSGGRPNVVAYWPGNRPAAGFIGGMNPVVMGTDLVGYNKAENYNFLSNIKLLVKIPWVKGLSVTGNASYDKSWDETKNWEIPYYLYAWDGKTVDENDDPVTTPALSGNVSDPQLTDNMSNGQRVTLNALLNYEVRIANNHNLKVLAGTERITGKSKSLGAFRRYFPSTVIDEIFAGSDQLKDNSGASSTSARMNFFGRVNYNYSNKYLLEFVWRYDGSYIFPEEGRWGFFPGVSAGWIISEENFWKNNISLVNYLKIRGSWGQTGNDRIDTYQYLATYGYGSTPYVFNQNSEAIVLVPRAIPNKEVTWEVANQSNIGFDSQFFGGRLAFSGDYFYNLRTKILWYRNASVPGSTGLTLPRENIGEVVNQGFEFQISYKNVTGKLNYNVSLNGSYAKNRIKFWDETPGVPEYQKSTGRPINAELYYKAIGIFKDQTAIDDYPHWAGAKPGDIIFEDVNNDDKIDGLDRIRYDKTSLPVFDGGINIDLAYSNFYASVFIMGAAGAVRSRTIESGRIGNYLAEDAEGRWTVDNPNATKPRTWNAANEYWSSSNNTYWLRNNDFIRLKNLQIGYNVPGTLKDRLAINELSIFFSGLNLITLSREKCFDPETVGNSYPLNKVYNVGIRLTF